MDLRDLAILQPREEAVLAAGRRADHLDLLSLPPVEHSLHQTNQVLPDARKGCQEQEDTKRSQHRRHWVFILSRAPAVRSRGGLPDSSKWGRAIAGSLFALSTSGCG